jgi:hypothetical protein
MQYHIRKEFLFPFPPARTVPTVRLPKRTNTSVVESIMPSAATQNYSLYPLRSVSFNPKVTEGLVSCLCPYSVVQQFIEDLCSYCMVQLYTDVCVLTVWYSFYRYLCSYKVVELLQKFVFLQVGTAFTDICVLTGWYSFYRYLCSYRVVELLEMFVFLQCGTAFTVICVLTVWYSFQRCFRRTRRLKLRCDKLVQVDREVIWRKECAAQTESLEAHVVIPSAVLI